MSTISAPPYIIVVESVTALRSLLDEIVNLPIKPPSLYVDLGKNDFGREGVIFFFALYVRPRNRTYLVNIHRFRKTAFFTTNSNLTSLKTVLESPTIPKVFFDVRPASNILFSHYEISVFGVKDVQLMELATRKGSKDLLAGVFECLEKDSPASIAEKAEWQIIKVEASRLYDPGSGGRWGIFNEVPMRPEIVQDLACEVALLPGLYDIFSAKLCLPGKRFWEIQIQEATKDRIKLSQSPGYDRWARTPAGPWDEQSLEQAIKAWNDDGISDALDDDDGNADD